MRAKVWVANVETHKDQLGNVFQESLYFHAVGANQYDSTGLDENNTYAKYTPNATFHMAVTNPNLFGIFVKGDEYYVDFTKIEKKSVQE